MNYIAMDFETTGLNARSSRIIEVGMVAFDESGAVLDEFESLIRPSGPISGHDVHGLRDVDLQDAPRFQDVLPAIASFIEDGVIVAHNAPFDIKFLERELELLAVTDVELSAICTLALLTKWEPSVPRRLLESCKYFGLPVYEGHRALNDARMTANLASCLIQKHGGFYVADRCQILLPPNLPDKTAKFTTRSAISQSQIAGNFLTDLVKRLPNHSELSQTRDIAISSYLELLDRVLVDRVLLEEESLALFELADDQGLGRDVVEHIHHAYFGKLLEIAKADRFLSVSERADLRSVAYLLNIPNWEEAIEEASEISVWSGGIPDQRSRNQPVESGVFMDAERGLNFGDPEIGQRLAGKSIVITGEFSEFSRAQGLAAIINRGGKTPASISKKTFALVVGDEAGPSKLEKAAGYGVPIINAAEFRVLLDSGKLPDRLD